ncbi:hypothetical protein ACO0M4_30670 [Streptomyces sp. RGM 3693]|uniref:hypothetical protein n=1 Tax=Streptomyces sp. RGM 3693 TaxID=3413284 RepID=UPI003D2C1D6A
MRTVALFVLTAATGLLLPSVEPSTTLTADIQHPATSLWLAPLLLGIGFAAPLPALNGEALRSLTASTLRALTAPTAAVASLCLTAWSGMAEHLAGFTAVAAVTYYWLTLGFVALRLCVLVARIARTAHLPTTRRLSTTPEPDLTILEVPIRFEGRVPGASKMCLGVRRESALTPWKLRFGDEDPWKRPSLLLGPHSVAVRNNG